MSGLVQVVVAEAAERMPCPETVQLQPNNRAKVRANLVSADRGAPFCQASGSHIGSDLHLPLLQRDVHFSIAQWIEIIS